jgi:hypothetical protein
LLSASVPNKFLENIFSFFFCVAKSSEPETFNSVQQNSAQQHLSCTQTMVTLCRALLTVISANHLHNVGHSYISSKSVTVSAIVVLKIGHDKLLSGTRVLPSYNLIPTSLDLRIAIKVSSLNNQNIAIINYNLLIATQQWPSMLKRSDLKHVLIQY